MNSTIIIMVNHLELIVMSQCLQRLPSSLMVKQHQWLVLSALCLATADLPYQILLPADFQRLENRRLLLKRRKIIITAVEETHNFINVHIGFDLTKIGYKFSLKTF